MKVPCTVQMVYMMYVTDGVHDAHGICHIVTGSGSDCFTWLCGAVLIEPLFAGTGPLAWHLCITNELRCMID